MYGLSPQRRPVTWRIVVPLIILVIAAGQFAIILAEYFEVHLPVRLDVTWQPARTPEAPAQQFLEAQAQLVDIPTAFSDPSADNYRWYTEAKLRQLTACMTRGDCEPNADKVRWRLSGNSS
jgi:hypothetical protein